MDLNNGDRDGRWGRNDKSIYKGKDDEDLEKRKYEREGKRGKNGICRWIERDWWI